MARRVCIALIVLAAALLTAGCWDRVEIQDKAIVTSMAIDVAPPVPSPADNVATFSQPHGAKKYRISYQIIKFAPTMGKDRSAESSTYVVSNTGQSIFEMVRDTLGQTSKILYFEHLESIIISEAVLKEVPLRPLIDYFLREPEYRWRVKLFVTSGRADEFLKFKTPTGEPGGQFIAGVINNQIRNAHIAVGRTDLGYSASTLDNDGDLVLPRVELVDNVFKMGGGAVFRKDRFAGYMDEDVVQGLRLLRGLQQAASIVAPCPRRPGQIMALKMTKETAEVRPHWDNGTLYFTIDIKLTGNLVESECTDQPVEEKEIPEFEAAFRDEVIRSISRSIQTCQSYPADPTGYFSGKVRAYLPDVWHNVENDWPAVFAQTPFHIDASVTIRNIGEHK